MKTKQTFDNSWKLHENWIKTTWNEHLWGKCFVKIYSWKFTPFQLLHDCILSFLTDYKMQIVLYVKQRRKVCFKEEEEKNSRMNNNEGQIRILRRFTYLLWD